MFVCIGLSMPVPFPIHIIPGFVSCDSDSLCVLYHAVIQTLLIVFTVIHHVDGKACDWYQPTHSHDSKESELKLLISYLAWVFASHLDITSSNDHHEPPAAFAAFSAAFAAFFSSINFCFAIFFSWFCVNAVEPSADSPVAGASFSF